MSRGEVERFFDEYVFGFVAGDVQREIDSAHCGQPAGNFLCALGLLCYTEVLGGVARGTLAPGESCHNFEHFFALLGPHYQALLASLDVYSAFRCGMVHEYFVKGTATVAMGKGVEPGGVAVDDSGHQYFVVERYFEDFLAAARALRAQLLAQPSPALPPELDGRV